MFAFFRTTKSDRKMSRQRAASWTPRLEVLEDRTVLSSTLLWYHYGSSGPASTLVDSSGHNFNATATGSTFVPSRPTGADSIPGVPLTAGALSINGDFGSGALTGASDIVSLASIRANGGLTFETWLYRNAQNNNTTGFQTLLELEAVGIFIPRNSNQLGFTNGEDSAPISPMNISIGEWHHVATVFDSGSNSITGGSLNGQLRFYLDGSLVSSVNTRIGPILDNLHRPTGISRHPEDGVETFNGRLFETRISLGALQPNQFLLPAAADIKPTSLVWNTTQGGVDFRYEVTGADLTQNTTAALYWASGPTFAEVLQLATPSFPIGTAQGSFGPIHVTDSVLFANLPPVGTKHLLLVADPNDFVAESNPTNNVISVSLAEKVLAGSVTVTNISGARIVAELKPNEERSIRRAPRTRSRARGRRARRIDLCWTEPLLLGFRCRDGLGSSRHSTISRSALATACSPLLPYRRRFHSPSVALLVALVSPPCSLCPSWHPASLGAPFS